MNDQNGVNGDWKLYVLAWMTCFAGPMASNIVISLEQLVFLNEFMTNHDPSFLKPCITKYKMYVSKIDSICNEPLRPITVYKMG